MQITKKQADIKTVKKQTNLKRRVETVIMWRSNFALNSILSFGHNSPHLSVSLIIFRYDWQTELIFYFLISNILHLNQVLMHFLVYKMKLKTFVGFID